MSEAFSVNEPDLTDALTGIREALARRIDEQNALTARLDVVEHQIAALREAEAILAEDRSETARRATSSHPEPSHEAQRREGNAAETAAMPPPDGESQISKVQALLAEHPDRTWRAQEVADKIGAARTKAQLDTVRTNLHRLVQRGHVTSVGRGEFRWGGA